MARMETRIWEGRGYDLVLAAKMAAEFLGLAGDRRWTVRADVTEALLDTPNVDTMNQLVLRRTCDELAAQAARYCGYLGAVAEAGTA